MAASTPGGEWRPSPNATAVPTTVDASIGVRDWPFTFANYPCGAANTQ